MKGPGRRRFKRAKGPHLKRRGRYFWIYGTYRGQLIRQTTGETDRDKAEVVYTRVLAKIDKETKRNGKPKKAKRVKRTYYEASCEYLKSEIRSQRTVHATTRMRDLVGETKLCEDMSNQETVDSLGAQLLEPGSKPQTLKRGVVATLSAVLNFAAAKWGAKEGCPKPSFAIIADGDRRSVVLMPHQAETIVAMATNKGYRTLARVVQIGICEAFRREEFFKLNWMFVDNVRGLITLRDTKSKPGSVRDRRINEPRPRTMRLLREMKAETGTVSGPVFVRDNGSAFPSAQAFGVEMNRQLREIVVELKWPDDVTLHPLRHSGTSWHYADGKNLENTRAWGDWKSIPNMLRYIHAVPSKLAPEITAFWEMAQN